MWAFSIVIGEDSSWWRSARGSMWCDDNVTRENIKMERVARKSLLVTTSPLFDENTSVSRKRFSGFRWTMQRLWSVTKTCYVCDIFRPTVTLSRTDCISCTLLAPLGRYAALRSRTGPKARCEEDGLIWDKLNLGRARCLYQYVTSCNTTCKSVQDKR